MKNNLLFTIAWKSTCALTRAFAICAEFWKCTLSEKGKKVIGC